MHGIPNNVPLEEGWVLSVDIGAFVEGFCGDSAWTYPVGRIDQEAQRLLDVTEKSLFLGIEKALVGNRVSDISHQVQRFVESNGFQWSVILSGMGSGARCMKRRRFPTLACQGAAALEEWYDTGD